MFAKHPGIRIRLLLPSLALVVFYAGCFASPNRRERQQVTASLDRGLPIVQKLRQEVNARRISQSAARITNEPTSGTQSPTTLPIAFSRDAQSTPRSFASACTELLSTLRMHGLRCTTTRRTDGERNAYQLTLHGTYPQFVKAWKSVMDDSPQLLLEKLEMDDAVASSEIQSHPMNTDDGSAICRWKITVAYEKVL